MFVSPAYAQAAGGGTAEGLTALLPLVLIFVVFYFLLIRPQQKKMKEHKEMLSAVRRGDRVVTGGGIIGTVIKVVNDDEVQVEIADNVRVRVQKAMIAAVLAKTEPAKAEGDGGESGGDAGAQGGGETGAKGVGAGLRKLLGGK